MGSVMKWSGVAVGLAGVLLLLAAPAVQAQNPYFQVRPGLTPQQYNYNMALYGRALAGYSPYGFGVNPYAGYGALPGSYAGMYSTPYGSGPASMTSTPYSDPYSSSGSSQNPYYPNYYENPYGSYLRGGAAVIDSQGRFLMNIQQANLLREQVRAERIANRRRAFDEYLYERERGSVADQQERERRLLAERERSRTDPPLTEIWSGKALNDILGELRSLKAKGQLVASRAPNVPLDDELLKHINVSGKDGGNLGLLKNEGRLTWPVALSGNDVKAERGRLNDLAQAAMEQAKFKNSVDAGTLRQMQNDLDKLHKQLSKNVGDLPTAQYIEARRFLNNFDDAVKVLGGTNPGNYVTRKWAAKGKNIVEVVDGVLASALLFAPAVSGDEAAYVAFHRALAAYATAMQTQVTAEAPK